MSSELHRVDSTSNILLNSGPQNPTNGNGNTDHLILHATVEHIDSNSIKLNKSFPEYNLQDTIDFEFMVYALGSIMPRSLQMDNKTLKSGTKDSGMNWLQHRQSVIEHNDRIVIAGGGALGIQLASDIKNTYPGKSVTLIHSRNRLLPRFDPQMHEIIMEALNKLGVESILEDRIELNNTTLDFDGHVEQKRVFTKNGRRIECDLVVSWPVLNRKNSNVTTAYVYRPETKHRTPQTALAIVHRPSYESRQSDKIDAVGEFAKKCGCRHRRTHQRSNHRHTQEHV